MVDITKITDIQGETKFIREREFDIALLEAFIGDRAGTPVERQAIRSFQKKLGGKIYVEAVYLLTHKLIPDKKKAKNVFNAILNHRREISRILSRPVGVQVAALDYMQNIKSLLKKPLLIEEEKSLRIARKALPSRDEIAEADTDLKKINMIRGRTVIRGVSVVPGFAAGNVFRYQDILSRELEAYDIEEHEIAGELKRFNAAIERVEKDLLHMKDEVKKQVNSEQASIFDAHRLILRDLNLLKEVEEELGGKLVNVEHIVKQVFHRWERKFRASQDGTIQERASDVADIGRRLLKELLGIHGNILSKLPPRSILFAKRLLPSDTVHLDRKNARGIVTQEGGPNSHVAILANAFGIPLVSRVDINMDRLPNSVPVILDGHSGKVILNPARQEAAAFQGGGSREERKNRALAKRMAGVRLEMNNAPVIVEANVASPEECRLAEKYGCTGVGLYRIEQIYMSSPMMPTEDFLLDTLKNALNPIKDKTVTLRLLDIGGDKTLPYIDLVERTNPTLGLRGVRLLLKYPNLLQTQLRVFLRLSALYDIRILVPMVSLPEDILEVRKVMEEEKQKLRKKEVSFNETIPLGAMIETPASVLAVEELLKICDFLSIGTNDLLQYLMAADRENMNVSDYYRAGNRLIFRWISEVAGKADRAGKECEVCGELAGDLNCTDEFLRSGISRFSVVPHLVPRLKEKIHALLNGIKKTKRAPRHDKTLATAF